MNWKKRAMRNHQPPQLADTEDIAFEDYEFEDLEEEEDEPSWSKQRAAFPPEALLLTPAKSTPPAQHTRQTAERQTAPAKNAPLLPPAKRQTVPAPRGKLPPAPTEQPPTNPPASVEQHPTSGRRLSVRTKLYILLGMLLVILPWLVWQQYLLPLKGWVSDQWQYGDSRMTEMDKNVGHGGMSHFLAEYYQGAIVVIELTPTGNHVYTLTGMLGATATPVVLLSTQDVRHDGKLDLIIQVENTNYETVLYNTGTSFSQNGG
jgi:hypothetical protein